MSKIRKFKSILLAIMMLVSVNTRGNPIIQEILYDGTGADSEHVFTELFGPPGMSLDGWSLIGINGTGAGIYKTVDLTGAVIPFDGILVIARSDANVTLAAVRDFTSDVDWQNAPDAVQLLDPSNLIIDAIQYGDAGANNAGEGNVAIDVPAGSSLSRDSLGSDTNDNSSDFSSLSTPTPGVGPVPPLPPKGSPKIQEILYDGTGADAEHVFTELFGPPGMSLDGWSLIGINGTGAGIYKTVDLTGAVIPFDGILVIARSDANVTLAAVRDFTSDVDWQNAPDAVQLLDPSNLIIDAIQYGDAGANNAGEGNVAIDVPAGSSLSRDSLGSDTNDNSSDFSSLSTPTPGVGPVPQFDVIPTLTEWGIFLLILVLAVAAVFQVKRQRFLDKAI